MFTRDHIEMGLRSIFCWKDTSAKWRKSVYSTIRDGWLNYLGVSAAKTAFGTKNLDPSNPSPTRSKPFTADNTVISGACRLGQRSLPLVSIYPHIHTFIPSFHPSIYQSIHPSTHSTDPSKRFIQPYSAGVWPKDDSVSGPNQTGRGVFWGFHLPASICLTQNILWKNMDFCALAENFTKPYN